MNLILFETAELGRPLPGSDARVRHVLDVLTRGSDDGFDAGLVNGPRGRAKLQPAGAETYLLEFTPTADSPPLAPITVVVGLPRPQTARDILRDATTLGVAALHFVLTEKGDPNYAQSTLWRGDEWRRCTRLGAEQAFSTRLPEVTHGRTFADVVAALAPGGTRLALDNYESPGPLSRCRIVPAEPVVLAIGAERGWSAAERARLRDADFRFVHLGERVLRTETACIAALTLVKSQLGLM